MNLANIHSIYFIGIGGIGMSGLARYFQLHGRKISGYDKTRSELTNELMREGMQIHFEEDVDAIPKDVDLVVYTPAVPPDHRELSYYREHRYWAIKRSDLLEELTKDLFTIAVAGTHGKTTTTSMIAHILKSSGYDCTAFLGGISANYHTNFLAGKNKTVVVEADEFDRSFLKLHPNIAVVTSSDADHLDIYGTQEAVGHAYADFAGKIKKGGILNTKRNLSYLKLLTTAPTVFYYAAEGLGQEDFYADNLRIVDGTYAFNFRNASGDIKDIHLGIAGRHNVENSVAAAAVASQLNIEKNKIREALNTFKGVKRRFEFIVRNSSVIYIDDYAHHPEEIKAFLASVREIFPGKKITCIFQPHLYTRTRDFADDFGKALSLADELILLPIYPARELPIAGVTSEMIAQKMNLLHKKVVSKADLLTELQQRPLDVLLTMGAGDIDTFIEPIKNLLNHTPETH